MKKIIWILFTSVLAFAIDLTYSKAFQYYKKGLKLEKTNPSEAQKYFKESFFLTKELESQNKASSQIYFMLGKMYHKGWGTNKNLFLAEKYYLKALKLGNKRVNCPLAKLYKETGKEKLAKKYLQNSLKNPSTKKECEDLKEIKEKK